MSAMNGEQRKQPDGRRLWLGLLAVLSALLAEESNPPPERPGQPGLAHLLEKVGDVIGRGFCWLETRLGLRPKNCPT